MKLIYFDLRGRAEPIRFILAAAGVDYEDQRLSQSQWTDVKKEMPWGQLPVLETDNGIKLAQGIAISRYLANKYNLNGKSDLEAAKCDEYIDALLDVIKEWAEFVWVNQNVEERAELKAKFVAETLPVFFGKLNKIIKENGGTYLVGDGLTWADIYIGCAIEALEDTTNKEILEDYPEIVSMRTAVVNHDKIKAWIDKRPAEDLMAIVNSMLT